MCLITTCRVEHRDYVPYGWIAVEFCDVEFFGLMKDEYEKQWREVKYNKCHIYDAKIEELNEGLKNLTNQIHDLEVELKECRCWWKFWNTKEEVAIKNEWYKLNTKKPQIEAAIEKYENDRFYDLSELMIKIEKLLNDNGFILKNSSSTGGGCSMTTDIWEKQ